MTTSSKDITSIQKELAQLNKEVFELKEIVQEMRQSCQRMDNHIGFIHSTYNIVRKPFALTLNAINRTLGNGRQTTLPQISDQV